MSEKACKNCHLITTTNLCPDCKAVNISSDWTGVAIILDPENSQIAETMKVKKPGRYALRVR
jgi:DNA-directed RNA polymerase subunit E"